MYINICVLVLVAGDGFNHDKNICMHSECFLFFVIIICWSTNYHLKLKDTKRNVLHLRLYYFGTVMFTIFPSLAFREGKKKLTLLHPAYPFQASAIILTARKLKFGRCSIYLFALSLISYRLILRAFENVVICVARS